MSRMINFVWWFALLVDGSHRLLIKSASRHAHMDIMLNRQGQINVYSVELNVYLAWDMINALSVKFLIYCRHNNVSKSAVLCTINKTKVIVMTVMKLALNV